MEEGTSFKERLVALRSLSGSLGKLGDVEEVITDLYTHIQETPLVDSHEHQVSEKEYLEVGADVLRKVFHQYVLSDLWAAGATKEAIDRLQNSKDEDVAGRFEGVRKAWERVQFTGYGDAACLIAGEVFGIEEMTGEAFAFAQQATAAPEPGTRLALLRDHANLDHVQIDSFTPWIEPDTEDPEFFLYDLSAYQLATGELDLPDLAAKTGVTVTNCASLREAINAVFAISGPTAIAVKTQHAYSRTLEWRERTDEEVETLIGKLSAGVTLEPEEKLCLGDWGLARAVEAAQPHNLPIKIHTGFLAGNDSMDLDRIRPAKLCPLLVKYPNARFVLMHTGYPYGEELAALAKQFANVYADLCWAWSIDPPSTAAFVRRMIHTAPSHKLFGFGGDTPFPEATVGFAVQAREGLNAALQAEVDAGTLSEPQAMKLATRFMSANQYECFDIAGKRAAIRTGLSR